jgi:hypothetical protein
LYTPLGPEDSHGSDLWPFGTRPLRMILSGDPRLIKSSLILQCL